MATNPSYPFAKGLLPYFAFISLVRARSIATLTLASPAVDTETVGEGDKRRAYGGLDAWLAASLGVEVFEMDILLFLDGVENLRSR